MTCQKVPYPDKSAAKAMIQEIRIHRRYRSKGPTSPKSGRRSRAYECPRCGEWHITTVPRRKNRAKNEKRKGVSK